MVGNIFSSKVLKSAAVASAAIAPGAAGAAIVHVTGDPVSLAISAVPTAIAAWNVDGVGNAEFELRRDRVHHSGYRSFTTDTISLASGGQLNGRGLFNSNSGIIYPLSRSFLIGPGLPSAQTGISDRLIVKVWTDSLSHGPDTLYYAVHNGVNLIGFAFDPGDGLHYGWARLELSVDGFSSAVTISEWAYQSEAGEAVHVASTPLPSAGLPAITLLGLGAAGLRAQRQRKRVVN